MKKSNKKGTCANNKRMNGNQRFKSNWKNSDIGTDVSKPERKFNPKGETNNMSWWSKNPELLAAAARIPFPYKPGMKLPTVQANFPGATTKPWFKVKIPGVMRLSYYYSIGWSDDVSSPASIAAKEIYARIRSKFSGSLVADAPDIFMYCTALDSINSYIAWLKRLYGVLNLYDSQNRDFPDVALKAMGLDDEDVSGLQRNRTTFWGAINNLVHDVNKFSLPDDMPIYERHEFLNRRFYLDKPVKMGQTMFFNPVGYFKFAVNESTHYGECVFSAAPVTYTVESLFSYGKALINALSDWDEAYDIDGYIQRAYEGTPFRKVELIDQSYVAETVYDSEILSQIENLVVIGNVDNSTFKVSQDPTTNAVIHKPEAISGGIKLTSCMLNLHSDNPTAADVTEASRFTSYIDEVQESSETVKYYIHGGTEIASYISLYGCSYGRDDVIMDLIDNLFSYDFSRTTQGDWATVLKMASMVAFNHAPMVWLVSGKVSSGSVTNPALTAMFDIDNLTVISESQLDELNRVCVYSAYNCFRGTV